MAQQQLAPIVLRAHKAWMVAAVAGALMMTTGCKHRRSALRPVFAAPGAVAAPCSNCGPGGSSTIIAEPGPSIGGGSTTRSLSTEPIIAEPSGSTDSSVPHLEAPSVESRPTSGRSLAPEAPPKASIDSEPDLDVIPSQSSRSRSLRVPLDPKTNSNSKSPSLQGPTTGSSNPTTWNKDGGVRTTSANGLVRRASVQDRLQPYFGEDGGDELFYPNKADRPWKYVVLHHSATDAGNYDEIDAEHRQILGSGGCGYHFVIGNGTGSEDGQIEVSQRWVNQKAGVHCRNARTAEIDEYGIGICFIGDFEKTPPTPRQLAAAKSLIAYLSQKYEIADSRVETHAHLAATKTVCPGNQFPDASEFTSGGGVDSVETRPRATRRAVPTALRVSPRQAGTSPH